MFNLLEDKCDAHSLPKPWSLNDFGDELRLDGCCWQHPSWIGELLWRKRLTPFNFGILCDRLVNNDSVWCLSCSI